jgi:hypothetical protein
MRFTNTVIPRYTNNRFTSFRLYKMDNLIPVFFLIYEPNSAYASSFFSQIDRCSRREVMGN